jgi:aspartyl-tRNA(Asn)/glutamyl-tRNA(Gln) amidotransferase subunit A
MTLMTASELVEGFASGEVSPVDVVSEALSAIERFNPELNAFRYVDAEQALIQAKASQERWHRSSPLGPIDGIPTAIKDTFQVRDWISLRGSLTTDPVAATIDGPSVERLRAAGAVFVGTTNTPEFAWKGVTDSPLTGVTRNPWDSSKTPGGSSGGSAVAVSVGMSTLALGTDGGGSVRIPAAFTGVVGLKPTHGLIPAHQSSPLSHLAHVGPMTRSVRDAALMLNVTAGPHPLDWTTGPSKIDYLSVLDENLSGLRIALLNDTSYPCEDPIAEAVVNAGECLSNSGAVVSEVSLPFPDPVETLHVIWFSAMAYLIRGMSKQKRDLLDPELRERIEDEAGTSVNEVLEAKMRVSELRQIMGRFHEQYDVLLTPTIPISPFDADTNTPRGSSSRDWTSWTPLTYPFNLTQQPAISIPAGLTPHGLPIGLQLVAAKHRDDLVLRTAYALEQAIAWTASPPQVRDVGR